MTIICEWNKGVNFEIHMNFFFLAGFLSYYAKVFISMSTVPSPGPCVPVHLVCPCTIRAACERFLVGRIGTKEYRLYRYIARYRYHNVHKDDLEFEEEEDFVCSIAAVIQSDGNSEPNGMTLGEDSGKDVGTGFRLREDNNGDHGVCSID